MVDKYIQLCVWPGISLGDMKEEDFPYFMAKNFQNIRVKYEKELEVTIDGKKSNYLFFYVHIDDVDKFAELRMGACIRWWEDIFINEEEDIFPKEFVDSHPPRW